MVKRNIILFAAAGLAFAACDDQVSEPVNFNVTLDKENTYYAGDPVKFDFGAAEVDNILFYSGETGAQYLYKDRYEVSVDDVNSAKLDLKYQARYGYAGGLDIYLSKDFPGLKGDDAEADKAAMKALSDKIDPATGDIPGWVHLEYKEGASTVWTEQNYNLDDFLSNVCVAIHWHPKCDGKSAQRTYWLSGSITLDIKGTEPTSMGISELNFKTVMLNDEIADPYVKNNGNATIILNKPTTADLIFQGIGPADLSYGLDGWAVSTPMPMNKVANDKGTVIKNLQNYMSSFEHVYEKPGTYTATFVGVNANYESTSESIKEVKIVIMDKP